jgi:hypothetical protein
MECGGALGTSSGGGTVRAAKGDVLGVFSTNGLDGNSGGILAASKGDSALHTNGDSGALCADSGSNAPALARASSPTATTPLAEAKSSLSEGRFNTRVLSGGRSDVDARGRRSLGLRRHHPPGQAARTHVAYGAPATTAWSRFDLRFGLSSKVQDVTLFECIGMGAPISGWDRVNKKNKGPRLSSYFSRK